MSKILDQILGRSNKGPTPVPTPEWPELNGQLAVRRLTPAERIAFYSLVAEQKPAPGLEFLWLAAVYCTVINGARAFSNEDWRALAADVGSGAAIERLAEAADEANCLSDVARESIKKKYATTPASDSTSASPATKESA